MTLERVQRRLWISGAVSAALSLGAAGAAEAQTGPRFLNPPGLATPRGYTHVVEVPAGRRLLFLSGQVPLDTAGNLRGGSDFRAQARQVFENLGAALAGAGADFDDVVKLNFYILDIRHLPALREVRDQYVNVSAPPASTLVEVSRLFREGVLLEVDAVAVVRP